MNRQPKFESLASVWERRAEVIKTRPPKPPLPICIPEIDKLTYGFSEKVSLIAARTSEGKTAFALQCAFLLADMGKTVLFVSLEDDVESMSERLFCRVLEVDNQAVMRGQFSEDQSRIASKIFSNLKLVAMDSYGYTWEEFDSLITDAKKNIQPDIIFFDYLQMVQKSRSARSKYEAIEEFANNAIWWNKKNKIPLVLTSQINRKVGDGHFPSLANMSGCDKIEQDAFLCLILHQPFAHGMPSWDFNKNNNTGYEDCPIDYLEIKIAKNKFGQKNVIVPVRFTGEFGKFESWDGERRPVYRKDWDNA